MYLFLVSPGSLKEVFKLVLSVSINHCFDLVRSGCLEEVHELVDVEAVDLLRVLRGRTLADRRETFTNGTDSYPRNFFLLNQ